jgi:hypothetical protein
MGMTPVSSDSLEESSIFEDTESVSHRSSKIRIICNQYHTEAKIRVLKSEDKRYTDGQSEEIPTIFV